MNENEADCFDLLSAIFFLSRRYLKLKPVKKSDNIGFPVALNTPF